MSTADKKYYIEILESAYAKAFQDYNDAEPRTADEYISKVCMRMFDYLCEAIKETLE